MFTEKTELKLAIYDTLREKKLNKQGKKAVFKVEIIVFKSSLNVWIYGSVIIKAG